MRATIRNIALASILLASAPASAQGIVQSACGASCVDVIGTKAMLQDAWRAFQDMGTTSYVGSQVGGTTLSAGSLLQAASVVGAPEVDRLLRTGISSQDPIGSSVMSAFAAGAGSDSSSIAAGLVGSSSYADAASAGGPATGGPLSRILADAGDPGFGGTAACDTAVGKALNKASETYVETVMTATTRGEYSFTKIGGRSLSSNKGGSDMFGGSCIEKFMQGGRDLLFKPPQLSDLLSGLTGAQGGGGSAGCEGGPSALDQIQASMPSGVFSGAGGFFPASIGTSEENSSEFWSGGELQEADVARVSTLRLSDIMK